MRGITRLLPSTNERRDPPGGRVADTNPMVRQKRGRQPPQREVLQGQRLVAGLQCPAAPRALERHAHVVPDVPVGIANELQSRRRVHADQPPRLDDESGLLVHFPRDGVQDGFADFHRATGEAPLPTVRTLLEQQATASIEDDGGDGGAHSDGTRGVTLERDHPSTLPDAVALRNVLRCVKESGLGRMASGAQAPAALNKRWNCSQPIGGTAPTLVFSSTCAGVFIPTSAVPMPGVERTNWSARCASVASPGMYSVITGGSRMSWPW